jgi:hypothetical protein
MNVAENTKKPSVAATNIKSFMKFTKAREDWTCCAAQSQNRSGLIRA